MKLEFWIAFRYLFSKKDHFFISRLLGISILTVAFSVFLPTVVLSIVNGFHTSIRDKILASEFEVKIHHRYDSLSRDSTLLKDLQGHPAVELAVPFFEKQALVKSPYAKQFVSVQIKAFYNEDLKKMSLLQREVQIVREQELSFQSKASKPVKNDLFQVQSSESILIGDALAYILELYSRDSIQVLIPQGEISDLNPKNIRTLRVQDLYSAGYAKFNKGIVFIRLDALSKVFALEERPTHIGIFLKPGHLPQELDSLLAEYEDLQMEYTLEQGIFRDFAREKGLMLLLFLFLLLSALVTIYISVLMITLNKQKEIGILKALGYSKSRVQGIFIFESLLISFLGSLLGMLGGLFFMIVLNPIVFFIERQVQTLQYSFFRTAKDIWNLEFPEPFYIIDPSVFYLQGFPYSIQYGDILVLSIATVLISLLGGFLSSRKSGQKKPAELL